MERKINQSENETRPLWRRKPDAVGKLRLFTKGMDPRRAIKPGQRIYATLEQLGTAVNQFDLLEGEVDPKEMAALGADRSVAQAKEKYEVVSKGGGWFNVINAATGKVMNESGMRQEAAADLVEQLEAQQRK